MPRGDLCSEGTCVFPTHISSDVPGQQQECHLGTCQKRRFSDSSRLLDRSPGWARQPINSPQGTRCHWLGVGADARRPPTLTRLCPAGRGQDVPRPTPTGGQAQRAPGQPTAKGTQHTWQENQPSGVQSRPPAFAPRSK